MIVALLTFLLASCVVGIVPFIFSLVFCALAVGMFINFLVIAITGKAIPKRSKKKVRESVVYGMWWIMLFVMIGLLGFGPGLAIGICCLPVSCAFAQSDD